MGKCRVVVGHSDFYIQSDWKKYEESDLENISKAIGEACLGEICLALHVAENLKFFGKDLLKQCIVTLEIEEDGEDK
jgi:hypothetical protein